MITTVIFDMDGLLFDTELIYFECYKKAAQEDGKLSRLNCLNRALASAGRKPPVLCANISARRQISRG